MDFSEVTRVFRKLVGQYWACEKLPYQLPRVFLRRKRGKARIKVNNRSTGVSWRKYSFKARPLGEKKHPYQKLVDGPLYFARPLSPRLLRQFRIKTDWELVPKREEINDA